MDMQRLISISTDLIESEYLRQIMDEVEKFLKAEFVAIVVDSANDLIYSQVYQIHQGDFSSYTGQARIPVDSECVLTYIRHDFKLSLYVSTTEVETGMAIGLIHHFLDHYYMKRELTLVTYDELTKTKNRKCFSEHLQELESLDSIIILDVDNFKHVNDTFGHVKGDRVLEDVGKFLVDICGDEYDAYRYGGDEFIILPKRNIHPNEINKFVNILHHNYLLTPTASSLGLSFSIGVAHARAFNLKFKEELIHYADQALYVSKFLGKNRVTIGKPSKTLFYELRNKLTELWYTLERGEVDNSLVLIQAPPSVNSEGLTEILQGRIRKVDVMSQYGTNYLILFDNSIELEILTLKYQDAIDEYHLSIKYLDIYKNFNFYKLVNTLDKELYL